MILRYSRDQLLDALQSRRKWAERYDAKIVADHRKAEREFLTLFRQACRDAVKWDYETAKEHYFSVEITKRDAPSCPRSAVAELERCLRQIEASRQQTYLINPTGDRARIHWVLTHDETIAELC